MDFSLAFIILDFLGNMGQSVSPAHVGTLNSECWALHLSISIHMSKGFSCSIKFFLLKITLGLALGESCVACATTEKH